MIIRSFRLHSRGSGIYGIDTLSLNPAAQYRLRINASDGEQYLSDYVPYVATPPIDSISWVYNSAGFNIYANTHDPSGNIRYFQWGLHGDMAVYFCRVFDFYV
jgi:hypothetical protein